MESLLLGTGMKVKTQMKNKIKMKTKIKMETKMETIDKLKWLLFFNLSRYSLLSNLVDKLESNDRWEGGSGITSIRLYTCLYKRCLFYF